MNPYDSLAARAARLRAETETELSAQLEALNRSAAVRLRGREPIRRATLAEVTDELAEALWFRR